MGARRVFRTVAITGVVGWLSLAALLYLAQDSLVFHPTRDIKRTPGDVGLQFEDVTISTADGERLGAWYVTAPGSRGTVLFCHGNAGNIGHRVSTVEVLTGLGLDVLILDYRGFGNSTGTPDEDGLHEDARAAWTYLVNELEVPPQRIVLMGRSLGGAVAVRLASEVEAAGLVVESSFTSVVDVGQQTYWFLPVSLLARNRFEAATRIGTVGEPVLVAHSPDDELIPFSHGRALFAASAEPREFLELRGGHNDGFLRSGAAYPEGLDAFFTTILTAR